MIFVVTGTHEQQFDRLVRAVDELPGDERRVVQTGYSTYVPQRSEAHEFLPFDEVRRLMIEADVVITHAGTGSTMLALSVGKLPLVAPRYARRGEHVDDHQHQLVQGLVDDGMAVPFFDGDDLAARVEEVRRSTGVGRAIEPSAELLQALREIVDEPGAGGRG